MPCGSCTCPECDYNLIDGAIDCTVTRSASSSADTAGPLSGGDTGGLSATDPRSPAPFGEA